MKLSFSKIKEFKKSPAHYLAYISRKFEATEAMNIGTLEHLAILQPEKIKDQFVFFEKVVEGTWAKKENAEHKKEIEENNNGKIVLDKKHYWESLDKAKRIWDHPLCKKFFDNFIEAEKLIKWEWDEVNWTGIIDLVSKNCLVDFKKVPDASPDKLRWLQRDRLFHWQAYLYGLGTSNELGEFYNVCYDDRNITVIRQDEISQARAKSDIEYFVNKFKQCELRDDFSAGFEFYSEKGYFESSDL